MKSITCPGCEKAKEVPDSALACSPKCRNRVWRRRHGVGGQRASVCGWCGAVLLYLPQDRLPGIRKYCDDRCARDAWRFARAKERMTLVKALNIAARRLCSGRVPSVLAAGLALAQLRDQLSDDIELERAARVAAFLSKLQRSA